MSVKKVSDVAKKFKIKLAQSPELSKYDPVDFEGAKKELGALTDVSEYKQKAPTPTVKTQPKTNLIPQNQNAPTDARNTETLPEDVKQLLNVGAPGVKGMLQLDVDGNRVSVKYNADRWTHGASSLKKVLTNALSPKYLVGDPIGYFNAMWKSNY